MLEKDFSEIELFVIGTSAGGVDILNTLLPAFRPAHQISVCVVIHLPSSGPNLIPEIFKDKCSLNIKEGESGEAIKPNTIYIAPPDYHLCVEPSHVLSLSSEDPVNFSRPSIDILFESAAYAYGKRVAAILCTGANSDGAEGLKKIYEAGGITIVQNPSDAEYEMMPESALKIMTPDYVFTSREIADLIQERSYAR